LIFFAKSLVLKQEFFSLLWLTLAEGIRAI
jgi:hypothetical protein